MLPEHLTRGPNGKLLFDGQSLEEIASRFGTPAYVISAKALRGTAKQLRRLVDSHTPGGLVSYAYKANSLPAICTIMKEQGVGAEVSSFMELQLALDLGIDPVRIVFNGPLKSEEALSTALKAGVGYLNADSWSELKRIDWIAKDCGRFANVGLRIGPTVAQQLHGRPTRFGVDYARGAALRCLKECRGLTHLRVCGIHFHLGTQIGTSAHYADAIKEALELVSSARDDNLLDFGYLDIGGGFAVFPSTCRPEVESYVAGHIEKDLVENVLKFVACAVEPLATPVKTIVEPGRLLVAHSALLLTRVGGQLSHKTEEGFVLDAGQSMVSSSLNLRIFHDILVVGRVDGDQVPTNLFGCLCYESDVLALRLPLPRLIIGDLLAILDCGAYDMPLTSSFIVPRPAVILVDGNRVERVPASD